MLCGPHTLFWYLVLFDYFEKRVPRDFNFVFNSILKKEKILAWKEI